MKITVNTLRKDDASYRETHVVNSASPERVLERLAEHCKEMTQLTGSQYYGYITY